MRGEGKRASPPPSAWRKLGACLKGPTVPKKKQQPDAVPAAQVVFRLPQNLHDALQLAAAGLGLDLSNLLRMMIAEHVPEYIERGRRAAAALAQTGAQATPAPAAEVRGAAGAGSTIKVPIRPKRSLDI
jgi:hypothetical protein